MKKIVVTGGSGFIGSNLINLLLKKKYFVINIDKSGYSANPYNVKSFKKNKRYRFFKLNINNKSKFLKIILKYKPVGILNLAAETHVDRSIDSSKIFISTNIFGTYNILELIRVLKRNYKLNLKLLHVSTDEVYGDIDKNLSASEKFNYNPSSPYSASKAGADQIVKAYAKTYGLKTLIANPCNNYGPNQFPEKFIPKMIFNIINNKNLPVYGKGKNVREWIFVNDTCEALLKIFLKGKIGESYNIGSGIKFNNLSIIKKLLLEAKKNKIKLGKNVKVKFVHDRPGHDVRYSLNSSKISKKLNWKHKTSISNGIKQTFDWYLKNINYFKKISRKDIIKRFGLKK